MYDEIINRLLDADADVLDGGGGGGAMHVMSNNNMLQGNDNLGSMGLSSTVQTELIPLLNDETAFDCFIECLTKPKPNSPSASDDSDDEMEISDDNVNVNDSHNDNGNQLSNEDITGQQQTIHIKRSFRTMTLIVNDTNSAQQMHERLKMLNNNDNNSKQMDEETLYEKFLISPIRAVLLAKKIFASYHSVYLYHVEKRKNKHKMNHGETRSGATTTGCLNQNFFDDADDLEPQAHLPHLNKVLTALLAAYPKQVILASCSGGGKMEETLEPMLLLQTFCPDFSSPIHTLVDLITMGCTGRKKQSSNLQQQAMMAANGGLGGASPMEQIYISCGHRKKFVRSLSQWGIVNKFVDVITTDCALDNYNDKNNNDENSKYGVYAHAAESACDALISIVEFICFPQNVHPALAANGNMNGSTSKSDKTEESAGEEELFLQLANKDVIEQLANCAHSSAVMGGEEGGDAEKKENQADVSSKALLGLFEIATGKARKLSNSPTLDGTDEDDEAVECKAQEEQTKEVPGVDDNKLLKAGVTSMMHSSLIANIQLVVQAMDISFKTSPVVTISGNEDVEVSQDNHTPNAVSHPGRYTIERPFTSRRLDLITLFADIICYEESNDDKTDHMAALVALEAVMELPIPLPNDVVKDGTILNPWPGLCDLLFDYPENNMYGVQFFRMLHGLCMTNHEKTLKTVVQKCKFLSRAIKEIKKGSSGSNRGVLLRCMNALRLHSQSVGPHSFLRHYIDSHDGWKAFQEDLINMTLEQQLPGGGIAVPIVVNNQISSIDNVTVSEVDINLGSAFAADLGFPPKIKSYVQMEEEFEVILNAATAAAAAATSAESPAGKKKKKKNNKKKKKK